LQNRDILLSQQAILTECYKELRGYIGEQMESWQFTKQNYSLGAPHFIRHAKGRPVTLWSQYGGDVIGGELRTSNGITVINEGDYIMKDINGEIYICRPEEYNNDSRRPKWGRYS